MANNTPALNFRVFTEALRAQQGLVDINTEVSLELEIGAITRKVYEDKEPAPLFNNIKGVSKGFRILGAPAGLSKQPDRLYERLAMHFDLPANSSAQQIVEKIITATQAVPIAPIEVDTGVCKENKWIGDEVDLTQLPIPLLHQEDGGRYIGTYGFHVVQSPDKTWNSWSIARTMLHNKNTLVGPAMSAQHIGMIRKMWTDLTKPTPWAMVFGAPPAALAVAGMPLPAWVSEADYVGALTGQAVEVVKTETNELLVPANAELVLEGEISLTEQAMEGPMGEYHGYSFPEGKLQPVFHVHAVTFRNNPILPICVAGLPVEENHTIWGTMIAAELLSLLRQHNLPVDMVWCNYEAATCWAVVAIDPLKLAQLDTCSDTFVNLLADIIFSSHAGWLVPKIILVSNDIDITDINQVVWALATRCHPEYSHYTFPKVGGIPLVPYLTPEEKSEAKGGKTIINCLYPEQFEGKMRAKPASFTSSYPLGLQQQVIAKWHDYGFK